MFQAGQPSTLHHGPAFAGPAGGVFQTGHRALELGEYVAGHQLVAVQDLFPGGQSATQIIKPPNPPLISWSRLMSAMASSGVPIIHR